MAVIGVLTVVLAGMGAPLTGSLLKAEAELKGFAATSGSTGKMAAASIAGIGLVAVAAMGLAVKAAADFEDAMTGVRKTVDEADLAAAGMTFEGLGMTFRQMATELPVTAVELAHIGETAGALGIHAADIETFTRTIAMLGITTDLSTSQAAESLGRVGTILGITGSGWAAYGDILVNLGNQGASTESQIQGVVERFASAGQQAGLTVPQILAFSSAIANVVSDPEAGGSSLSRLFGGMILGAANATKAGQAFAKTTGMAFGDFSKLVKTDTVGAMLLVLKSLQGLDTFGQAQALKSMGITQVRDVNAIRALAATYETNLLPAIEAANKSQGAAATETEKRLKALEPQITLLANSFIELGISLGTALLPALTAFVQQVTGAVNSVSAWAAANPQLASSILPIIAGVGALAVAALVLGPVFTAAGALIMLALNPVALLIAGILASLAAIGAFVAQNNAIKAQHPDWTPAQIAAEKFNTGTPEYQHAATAHGYSYRNNFNETGPWGSFNTPGFHAGQAGSPYAGPPTPITLNHTSNIYLDGQKVGEVVDRRQYDMYSVVSSGMSSTDHPHR